MLTFVFSAGVVSAQEETITADSDTELVAEGEMTSDEELTTEEEEIVEEAEDLVEADVDSGEDLSGEIILITEDEVVVKKADGSIVKVDTTTYSKKRPGAHRRQIAVGQKITTSTVASTEGGLAINTATGVQAVSGTVPVTKNRKVVAQSSVQSDDEVVAMYDEDGNLIGLEIISDEEMMDDNEMMKDDMDDSKKGKAGIIIVIVLAGIIAGALFARRK